MRTDQIDRVGMANNTRTKNAKEHYSEQRFLELFLIITVLGITALFWYSPTFELALLSLYFLPVTLGGFFLGRYRASMLTLFCVLCASGCVLLTPLVQSPLTIGITLFVWTCVMAITVFLIGTLSDQRQRELADLHECHKTDTLLDMLTGVANRRAFENELNRRSAEWHHRQIDYSLLLVDIDHFKKFNDIYGHQVGDAVLRGVAQQIKDSVRETDLVARYGGEEIAVIMPETTEEEVKQIGERVREAIERRRYEFQGLKLRLTVSIGAARIIEDERGHSLLERADVALYASKQAGRNCAHFHNGNNCHQFGMVSPHIIKQDSDGEIHPPVDSYADQHTGLPSRKVFVEELRRRLAETRRHEADLSLMLVRVDQGEDLRSDDPTTFRKAILFVGEAIQNMMRDSDLVARFDEDQFAVLLPSTALEKAITPAERLRERVAEYRSLMQNGVPFNLSVSIGVTGYIPSDDLGAIVNRMQQSVESAIERGGNFAFYDDGGGSMPAVFSSNLSYPVPRT